MLLLKEREELVQLAYKKVIKYDLNWNELYVYDSVKSCLNDLQICTNTLNKYSNEKKAYNGYFYIIQDPPPFWKNICCENCGKEFQCQTFRIKKYQHLFCSRKCEYEWRKSQSPLNCTCAYCGKQFHRKENHKRKNIKNYCSTTCANNDKKIRYSGSGNHQYGLKGNLNASWKSDERFSFYGYKLIRAENHPFKNCDNFVFEHRLIAEKYLLNDENSIVINDKQYLSPDYVVHHLNFDRQDNDVKNLLIMKNGEHTSLHIKMNNDNEALKKYCQQYNLNFEEVVKNHIYNCQHYKYKKTS